MARLVTSGFEWNTTALSPDTDVVIGGGGSVGSTNPRSGTYCLEAGTARWNFTGISARGYYARSYFKIQAPVLATAHAISIRNSTTNLFRATYDLTTGVMTLSLFGPAGTQIGSSAGPLNLGQYYRCELFVNINSAGNDSCELRLDGVTVASTSGSDLTSSLPDNMIVQAFLNNLAIDDVGLNDDQGASQNTWLGSGKIVLLKPISDNAVGTGWTLGTGTATGGNGFAAVDNTPPTGVADLAAGSDPKQIRNAASAANSNYDANMTSYTTAGVAAADTINVVVPAVNTSAPVTTSAKAGTVGVVSNPAIANVNLGALGTAGAFWGGTAAGTFGTGWAKWSYGTTTYAPAVTLGTSPVMRITQVTASTRIAMVDAMGIYVDYTPSVSRVPRSPGVDSGNAHL